jgi:multicomponent Na+:H+ antiporter subunit E
VVTFIAHRMDLADREGHPVHLSWRALIYWPWLIKEIVMANIEVAKAITRTSMDIEPTVIRLKASQTSELGRVIYANSITLTPGTVTIGLEGEDLTVHALTRRSKESLETGEMDRKVTAMAGSD